MYFFAYVDATSAYTLRIGGRIYNHENDVRKIIYARAMSGKSPIRDSLVSKVNELLMGCFEVSLTFLILNHRFKKIKNNQSIFPTIIYKTGHQRFFINGTILYYLCTSFDCIEVHNVLLCFESKIVFLDQIGTFFTNHVGRCLSVAGHMSGHY